MGMDWTGAWPYWMSTQQKKPGTRTEVIFKRPPVTDCSFRTDGNSQGTYISSLASTATREISAEKSEQFISKRYQYEQEQVNSFKTAFDNEGAMFNFGNCGPIGHEMDDEHPDKAMYTCDLVLCMGCYEGRKESMGRTGSRRK
jgi:hypothetical protein